MCDVYTRDLQDKQSDRIHGFASNESGFTLLELVLVIILLGILSSFALPKYSDSSSVSKTSVLYGIAGSLRSTIAIVKTTAYAKGLSPQVSNPRADQDELIIETDAGSFEVMFSNLCPESEAELADQIDMTEHLGLETTANLVVDIDNRYTRIGYDIQGTGAPTANGCYVTYDSFGGPAVGNSFGSVCPVTVVTADC